MAIHVHNTKEEIAERKRLEAILVDETKTEADRDFCRERLQAIREAAVGRAKVRAERRADYIEAEPADEPEPAALPEKPTQSEDESDAAYENRLAHWRLDLDLRAAGQVLNDVTASLAKRQSAKATIRRAHKDREALKPQIPTVSGIALAPAPKAEPFRTPHEAGTAGYEDAMNQWMKVHGVLAAWRWKDTDPEAFAKHDAFYNKPKTDNSLAIWSPDPNAPKPFIASPLQKQVWGEQSKEFARQRGEAVAEPTTAPIVAPRSYRTAYKILLDGLIVWPWGEVVQSQSLSNVQVFSITAPPGYVSGSGAVPQGWQIDEIDMLWRKQ
jgi:hypothetical protein